MVYFLLHLVRQTLQLELDRFMENQDLPSVSKQAFSEARHKLSPEVLIESNRLLVSEFYTDNEVQTWQGYLLLSADGSTVTLPNSEELQKCFPTQGNQHGAVQPLARISVLYDLLNDITLDGALYPDVTQEREWLLEHLQNSLPLLSQYPQRLLVLDMGYPAFALFDNLLRQGLDFVIRAKPDFCQELIDFAQSGQNEQILDFKLGTTPSRFRRLKQLIPGLKRETQLTLRLVRIPLSSGIDEFLVTSLLDRETFPYEGMKVLYFRRWPIETNYSVIKCLEELPNFSGKSEIAVQQDFYATLTAHNIRALIVRDAQIELEQQQKEREKTKPLKYRYKINNNIALGHIKRKMARWFTQDDPEVMNAEYQALVKRLVKNKVPIRPERASPRKKKGVAYPMNRKRAL